MFRHNIGFPGGRTDAKHLPRTVTRRRYIDALDPYPAGTTSLNTVFPVMFSLSSCDRCILEEIMGAALKAVSGQRAG